MTDKEIRALIEKRRKEWRYGSSIEAKYKGEECDDILELLDSIQEEPVSEDKDLEETISTIKLLTSNTALLTFEYGFRKGAQWQKKQMMAKAIDGDVTFDYYGDDDKTYGCIAHDSFCLEDFGLKDRDKVKVIVIKED